ncbi:MAG: diaminopimelate epimerase, partial [Deltaproteobacteria bacterium]
MRRPFAKYEGLGNDFVVLEAARWPAEMCTPALALALCDRHLGIGGDGILWLEPRDEGSVGLVILNADGSRPEMCGNGVRCVA